MPTPISWSQANFSFSSNNFTWGEIKLILAAGEEDWSQWNEKKKKKLVKLILKVHGNTMTESKQKEIKQYKIKATDIRLAVKEVLGVKMIAEGISI
jgi:hypothetical protein